MSRVAGFEMAAGADAAEFFEMCMARVEFARELVVWVLGWVVCEVAVLTGVCHFISVGCCVSTLSEKLNVILEIIMRCQILLIEQHL